MKPQLVAALALFAASACARVVSPDAPSNLTSSSTLNTTTSADYAYLSDSVTAADDDPWTLSLARGTKLLQGMKSSDTEAATLYALGPTSESPFDGSLIDKLREWGYNDNTDALAKKADPRM
jgi:hypothetical protein